MKTKDVVIGLIILVILITSAILIRNARRAKTVNNPLPTPNYQIVEKKFPSLTVPSNADRIGLNSVSGGEGKGEAFKTFQNGQFNLTTVAELPAPNPGYFYQAWLVRGDKGDFNYSLISLGKLSLAKGGYITEFAINKNYPDYKKVIVTLEKALDNTPEVNVLEGSF